MADGVRVISLPPAVPVRHARCFTCPSCSSISFFEGHDCEFRDAAEHERIYRETMQLDEFADLPLGWELTAIGQWPVRVRCTHCKTLVRFFRPPATEFLCETMAGDRWFVKKFLDPDTGELAMVLVTFKAHVPVTYYARHQYGFDMHLLDPDSYPEPGTMSTLRPVESDDPEAP